MAEARIDIPPLRAFDPLTEPNSVGQRWKLWKKRFETYLAALGITDNTRKRALLLYQAGEATQEIFETLPGTGNADDYTTAMTKLDQHFQPKRNVDFEIFKFRTAVQAAEETLDQFTTRLRKLGSTCDFADLDKELKSVIIQNCFSKRLRRFALLEPDLTLDKLLAKGRAFEISDIQASGIEESLESIHLSENVNFTRARHQSFSSHRGKNGHSTAGKSRNCRNCGRPWPHTNAPCPARGKQCNSCGKPNHFAKFCRSTKVPSTSSAPTKRNSQHHTVRQVQSDCNSSASDDEEYLFTVSSKDRKTPKACVKIENITVEMVVDTGASIDIIDEPTFAVLQKSTNVTLLPPKTRIFAYGAATDLKVLGIFNATLESKFKFTHSIIHVVKGNYGCLLSYTTASALGLVTVSVQAIQHRTSNHQRLLEKYGNIFDGIGQLKDFSVKLHIDPTVTPVAQPARKIPFHMRKQVADKLKALESQGIIEKATGPTPWISPLVVIPKKDGDVRLCVDMRMPNRAILRERHPTPTVDDLIHTLNGAKVFSKLDLRSGYHQLLLNEDSRYITTFQTHKGLHRYRTLNFGTSSASEVFQHAISEELRDIPYALNISDDVIVFGKTQEDHDIALESVFKRFSSRGLTLNKEKCEFSKDKLTFFGFVFSANGISPDPLKVEAIKNAPAPTTQSGLRSFLGMATYCSKFIANFSDITQPLRELTRKDAKFHWTKDHERAFNAVKATLTSDAVMSYFDPLKETELTTDASPFGLSAILAQHTPGQTDRKIVAYISRSLSDVERRYSQTEKEALAIVWAMEKLYLYLSGGHFTLITDCKPIEMILNNPASKPPARIARWYLRIQEFDFTVQHIKGTENPSDFLSRHVTHWPTVNNSKYETVANAYVNFLVNHAVPKAMTLSQIQEATTSDSTLQYLIMLMRSNKWDSISNITDVNVNVEELKLFSKLRNELTVNDASNLLLRDTRIVLPSSLRNTAIQIAQKPMHNLVKTKRLLRTKVWFPHIDRMVQNMVERCLPCQANGLDSRPEPLSMNELPPSPWHTVHLDFCGPFPSGEYALVVIDAYSRFPEVEIVNSTSAKATTPKLERIFATHGIPHIIKSDNGPPFSGHEFYTFLKELGSKHKRSIPLSPQGNGLAESFMKPLQKAIRTAVTDNRNWKRAIFPFLLNYRATPHSTTGKSPAELLYNRKLHTKLPERVVESDANIHQEVKEKDCMKKEKMKIYADKKSKAAASGIEIGDSVLVRQKKDSKLSTKFNPKPYKVTSRKGARVTVCRNGHYVTRNASHFKKLPTDVEKYVLEDNESDYCFDFDNEPKAVNEQAELNRYPVRVRTPVQRYGNNIFEK